VLGSWAFLGWRMVTVESGPGSGIGAVDNGARPASWAATLPPGGAAIGGAGSGVPANYHDHNHNPAHVPANDPALANDPDPGPAPANDPGSVPANGAAPEPVGRGTSSSRGSVSLPK
jgi:hypothetical protein